MAPVPLPVAGLHVLFQIKKWLAPVCTRALVTESLQVYYGVVSSLVIRTCARSQRRSLLMSGLPRVVYQSDSNPDAVVLVTGGSGLVGKGIQELHALHPLPGKWIFASSKEADLR